MIGTKGYNMDVTRGEMVVGRGDPKVMALGADVPAADRRVRRRICMITHSHYESDNRVRRYAEALVKRGDQVDVIAVGSDSAARPVDAIAGVTVYRIQSRERNERSKWTHARRLIRFLVGAAVFLARHHRQHRYDLIHVHNVPDFLVFAAWYPKLTGAKIILDIHDIVPELYASKFGKDRFSPFVSLLKLVEKVSCWFADHVIVSNDLWKERLLSRSVPRRKCSVFVNHVDRAIFYRRPRTRNRDKFIILFPGVLQKHQGLDVAIRAFALIAAKVPNAEFHIYGSGDAKDGLIELTEKLGLVGRVRFLSGVPLNEIAPIIANADLGVVPKLANSFGNEAYSTKIMEFMSQGVPVIVSRTKIDSFYFNDNVVRFFESGNAEDLAAAMLDLINNEDLRNALAREAFKYVDQNDWDVKRDEFLNLIDSLLVEEAKRAQSPTKSDVAILH